jgi:2-iminobutanoate/2-iminopropanoate deaminase
VRVAVENAATPKPRGCYSRAIIASGPTLYVGGQEPVDPETGHPVGGSMAAQTEQALRNLQAVVEAGGGRLANAVKVTAYISDLDRWDEFDQAYRKFFPGTPPARTTIRCDLPGFDVEVDAIVALDT